MIDRLGTTGIVGVLLALVGIGVVAFDEPVVAGGIALTLAGVGLVVKGLVDGLMSQFGFA
ncbi:MAG: hypothetical protein ABEI75_03855 [Halobaculum sp.]